MSSLAALRVRLSPLVPLLQKAAAAPLLGLLAYAGRQCYTWLERKCWLQVDVAAHSEANR